MPLDRAAVNCFLKLSEVISAGALCYMAEGNRSGAGTIKALILADVHMREVITTCALLERIDAPLPKELLDCMMGGIVVSYARSFMQNDGVSSLPDVFSTFPNKGFASLHKAILESRNKRYAHASRIYDPEHFTIGNKDEMRKVFIVIAPDGRVKTNLSREGLPIEWVPRIHELAIFQRQRIRSEGNQRIESIVTRYRVRPGRYELGKDFPPSM